MSYKDDILNICKKIVTVYSKNEINNTKEVLNCFPNIDPCSIALIRIGLK
jgi:hypothetical protein